MGCTDSRNAIPLNGQDIKRSMRENGINGCEMPPSIAFEIQLDESDDSLIRKYPPKRFQRLGDIPSSASLITHEMLQEKMTEAEQRRLQILNERIKSAKNLMKPKNYGNNLLQEVKPIAVEG